MHSLTQRLNGVSAQGTTFGLLLLLAIAISSLFIPAHVEPARLSVGNVNVMVGRGQQGKAQDFLFTKFDLKADLTPLFNYNTKQLMLQVVAEFQTKQYPENAVVLWDRIVRRKNNAKINMEGIRNKYAFKSLERLTGTNMTLALKYHVMPHVGLLRSGEAGRTGNITIPPPQQQVH